MSNYFGRAPQSGFGNSRERQLWKPCCLAQAQVAAIQAQQAQQYQAPPPPRGSFAERNPMPKKPTNKIITTEAIYDLLEEMTDLYDRRASSTTRAVEIANILKQQGVTIDNMGRKWHHTDGRRGTWDRNGSGVEIERETIFVTGLGASVTVERIQEFFEQVGPILRQNDKENGNKEYVCVDIVDSGMCYITFENADSAEKAIADFHWTRFPGAPKKKRMTVEYMQVQQKRSRK